MAKLYHATFEGIRQVDDAGNEYWNDSLLAFVNSICDIMRRSNCSSALQYVPELTWILFLRILDAQEQRASEAADWLECAKNWK